MPISDFPTRPVRNLVLLDVIMLWLLLQTLLFTTYWFKAHIREMRTPPKLSIGHGPPLPFFRCARTSETIVFGNPIFSVKYKLFGDWWAFTMWPWPWTFVLYRLLHDNTQWSKSFVLWQRLRPIVHDTYKTAKINIFNSGLRLQYAVFYIHVPWVFSLIYAPNYARWV